MGADSTITTAYTTVMTRSACPTPSSVPGAVRRTSTSARVVRSHGPEDEDSTYAARCRSMVTALGLDEHIEFLGPRRVSEIYPQLDVLVLTSFSEGQPLVILEAFAHGLPVVATDVGACRELIEGSASDRKLGRSGIVTRVASPTDTAAALVQLAQQPSLRQAMGAVGAARVATRYQLEQVLASYDSLYSCLVTS